VKDARLSAIALLVPLGLVGHFIQLAGEDFPWSVHALERYYVTPGWHLWLHPVVPAGIAVALAGAAIGLVIRRTDRWLLAVVGLYAAHYLTYPFRIRNHMTFMFAELVMIGGVLVIARSDRARREGWAMIGAALVLCITYASAALHKTNTEFLAFDAARSSAVDGLTTFFIYGDLGNEPPRWAMALAIYGTIAIEALAPILAWRVERLRIPMVLALFAFHFPHVAVMNVADYPMIASAFYPAFFRENDFARVLEHMRPSVYTVLGAVIGVALQLWFMPWIGALTLFGIVVTALWGWSAAAMIRSLTARKITVADAHPAEVG
jgi:hypothetical protein